MLPWPSFSVPFQIAVAVRCMWLSYGLPDSVPRNSCGRGVAFGQSARNCFTLARLRNPAFARVGSYHVCTKNCPLRPEKAGTKRPLHKLEVSAVSLMGRRADTYRLDVRACVMDLDLYDGDGDAIAFLISVHVGGRGRRLAGAERMKILLNAFEAGACNIFIDAEGHEGDQRGEGPEFGAIGEFSLGFPTEQAAGDFEGDQQAERERDEIREDFDRGGGVGSGGFEAVCQVGGGHEQSSALNPVREDGERHAGA